MEETPIRLSRSDKTGIDECLMGGKHEWRAQPAQCKKCKLLPPRKRSVFDIHPDEIPPTRVSPKAQPSPVEYLGPSAWERSVRAIAARDGWGCHYCGLLLYLDFAKLKQKIKYEEHPTRDHVHPKVKGGTRVITNLVLACEWCNSHKGDRDYAAFMKSPALIARIEQRKNSPNA